MKDKLLKPLVVVVGLKLMVPAFVPAVRVFLLSKITFLTVSFEPPLINANAGVPVVVQRMIKFVSALVPLGDHPKIFTKSVPAKRIKPNVVVLVPATNTWPAPGAGLMVKV